MSARSVDALVVGEHGTSEVFLWSTARVGGVPIESALPQGTPFAQFRADVERDVRYANITIIEGNDASQFGIGIVSTRITEAVLRDERAVLPVGEYNSKYGVTMTLPCIVGGRGAGRILEPAMSAEERTAFERSADVLRAAKERTVASRATKHGALICVIRGSWQVAVSSPVGCRTKNVANSSCRAVLRSFDLLAKFASPVTLNRARMGVQVRTFCPRAGTDAR